ncbi:Formyl-CoA:oxalate CoA-transferase [Streptomyces griseomycini]
MFTAAVIARAATGDHDVHACLRTGLTVVPPRSRLARAVRQAVRLAREHTDFAAVVDRLHALHGATHHWVHAVPNTALITAALTHADGDFTGSVCRAVSGGWDTDSNGATAGSIAGLLAGSPGRAARPLDGPAEEPAGDLRRRLPRHRLRRPGPPDPPGGLPPMTPSDPTTAPPPAPAPAGPPLTGLRVLDAATLFAGPLAATMLGDFGAEVVKIEHPTKPDPSRGHGPSKDGVGLWWKVLGRNKRNITLDLSKPGGRDTFLKLAGTADVVIENFRPGTLEKWDLGWPELSAVNPRLVLARVTGFGQFGPYAHRPGFGTLAEAMSGFAAITGEPDAPPTLPPFGLADSIAGLATAYAVMTALAARDRTGEGQVVDMALIEPILTVLGPQPTWYDQLGHVQPRTGNRSQNNAPRSTYLTADGTWVAVSTSAQSVAERVMHLVGRPELIDEPWFATGADRARHADVLDEAVGGWIARHTRTDVLAAFEKAEAAVAPVQDVRDVMADPQYQALGTITTVDDPELGPLRMQNVLFRLSGTPGAIRWAGRPHGADTEEVLTELGLAPAELAALRAEGAL